MWKDDEVKEQATNVNATNVKGNKIMSDFRIELQMGTHCFTNFAFNLTVRSDSRQNRDQSLYYWKLWTYSRIARI